MSKTNDALLEEQHKQNIQLDKEYQSQKWRRKLLGTNFMEQRASENSADDHFSPNPFNR